MSASNSSNHQSDEPSREQDLLKRALLTRGARLRANQREASARIIDATADAFAQRAQRVRVRSNWGRGRMSLAASLGLVAGLWWISQQSSTTIAPTDPTETIVLNTLEDSETDDLLATLLAGSDAVAANAGLHDGLPLVLETELGDLHTEVVAILALSGGAR